MMQRLKIRNSLMIGLYLSAQVVFCEQAEKAAPVSSAAYLIPPRLVLNPGPVYWPRVRTWQGIPSIERTPGGRLWATWYAGVMKEGYNGNYSILVTSADDGVTWSAPVAVYDPHRTYGPATSADPHLWVDPKGNLWWFVNLVPEDKSYRGLWAFRAKNPESAATEWDDPVFVGPGLGLNKPTVLSNGDWLCPVDVYGAHVKQPKSERAQWYISKDQGKSYSLLSSVHIEDVDFSEHMVAERKDGSLWMLARTSYGIAQTESVDGGKTWINEGPFTKEYNVRTRFFLRRLHSGRLLLVVNDSVAGRSNLTAMLSGDDGKTWPYKLLLDERNTSYPDGTESADGFIYVIYDNGRYTPGLQAICFSKITEQDIMAGKVVNPQSRLKQLINRLSDSGGGVLSDYEPDKLLKEFNAQKNTP